jgi:pSer/pThr/pTyr-binding forkhead associated (FHA) protein
MPQVFIMNGPDKGRSFALNKDTVFIGRGSDNDIRMTDNSVSHKHLKIVSAGNKYSVTDLGSKNGTFVDGMRIWPQTDYEVEDGIPVAVGRSLICIGRPCPNGMLRTPDSTDVLKELAEEAVRLEHRAHTAKKNMELIYEAFKVLIESENVKDALEEALNHTMELLQRVDRGAIILVDSKTKKISEVISIPKTNNEEDGRPYSATIVEKVLKEGKPVLMLNTLAEDESTLSESIFEMQIRSVMCVPLLSKSDVIGAIYIDAVKRPYGFRKEDLELLNALSSAAALAIEKTL